MVDESHGSEPQRHPSPSLIRLPSSSDSAPSSTEPDESHGSEPQRHPSPSSIRLPSSSDSASSLTEPDMHTHDVDVEPSVPPKPVELRGQEPSDDSQNMLREENQTTEPLPPSASASHTEDGFARPSPSRDTIAEEHQSTEPSTLPTLDGHTENDLSAALPSSPEAMQEANQLPGPSVSTMPGRDSDNSLSTATPSPEDTILERAQVTGPLPVAEPNPGSVSPELLASSMNRSRNRGDSVPDAGSTKRCFACSRISDQLITPCTCSSGPQPGSSPRRLSDTDSGSTSLQTAASVLTLGEARTFLRCLSAPPVPQAEPVARDPSVFVGHQGPGPSSVATEPTTTDLSPVGDRGPRPANAAAEEGPRLGHSAQPSSSTDMSTTPGWSTYPSTALNTTRNSQLTPPTAPTSPINSPRVDDNLECGCTANSTHMEREHEFCQRHNPNAEQDLQSALENLVPSSQGNHLFSDADARTHLDSMRELESSETIANSAERHAPVIAPRRRGPVISAEPREYLDNEDQYHISPPPGFDESMRGRHDLVNQGLLLPTSNISPTRSGDLSSGRSGASVQQQQNPGSARPSSEVESRSPPPTYRSRLSSLLSSRSRRSGATAQQRQQQRVPGSAHSSIDIPELTPPPTYPDVLRENRVPAYTAKKLGFFKRIIKQLPSIRRPQRECEDHCKNACGCGFCGSLVDNVVESCVMM